MNEEESQKQVMEPSKQRLILATVISLFIGLVIGAVVTYLLTKTVEPKTMTTETDQALLLEEKTDEIKIEFVASDYFPDDATEQQEFQLDFNGDGLDEQVIFYEINEALEDGSTRDNQHLKVFAFEEGEWVTIKEDQAEASSTYGDTSIDSVKVITFTNDDREQLLIFKCAQRCRTGNKYYVFGYDNGQYIDLAIPKGYLSISDYLADGDTHMDLRNVKESVSGLVETYEIYCDEKEEFGFNYGTDDSICRTIEIQQTYSDNLITSEPIKNKFLFLTSIDTKDLNDYYVDVYNNENDYNRFGSIILSYTAFAAELINDRLVYFVDENGGITNFDTVTAAKNKINIPDLDEEAYKSITDFVVNKNTIYYLKGGCQEVLPCHLYSYDLVESVNTPILINIPFIKHGGMSITNFDTEQNALFVTDGWGDGGYAARNIRKIDLDTKEITTIASYTYQSCGENNENCNEEDLKNNKDYDEANARPTSFSCEEQTTPYKEGKVFIGCKS